MSAFYADMVYGGNAYLLDGPYPSEPEARAALPAVKAKALDRWPEASFAAFGTCSSKCSTPGFFSPGGRGCK